jgi:hypothetical protein
MGGRWIFIGVGVSDPHASCGSGHTTETPRFKTHTIVLESLDGSHGMGSFGGRAWVKVANRLFIGNVTTVHQGISGQPGGHIL